MRIGNLLGNAYYFVNDWFEFKKHSLYIRFTFEPSAIMLGIDFMSPRLFTIYIPFFNLCVHWLTKRNDDEEEKKN